MSWESRTPLAAVALALARHDQLDAMFDLGIVGEAASFAHVFAMARGAPLPRRSLLACRERVLTGQCCPIFHCGCVGVWTRYMYVRGGPWYGSLWRHCPGHEAIEAAPDPPAAPRKGKYKHAL
jgi:hypothetical protein